MRSAISEQIIEEQISRWENGGRRLSPQEICGGQPELATEVARRILALESIERLLEVTCQGNGHKPLRPRGLNPRRYVAEMVGACLGAGYEMGERIGIGAFGVVYRARQLALHRSVAVKVVSDGSNRRIEREARALAKVASPHVVTIYDFREVTERLYILVMELVEGGNLLHAMEVCGGRIDEFRALSWMQDVACGMLAVAKQGIIHRDLKPANILIDDEGRAKVADFGLAIRPSTSLASSYSGGLWATHSGGLWGTPLYIAPEQAKNAHDVDTRADIYSFGATFYHALVGEPPFDGDDGFAIVLKHIDEAEVPVPAIRRNPSLSEHTSNLLQRCLAKSPDDRFQDFAEIITYLEEPIMLPKRRDVRREQGKTTPKARESASQLRNRPPLWVYKCNKSSGAQGDWDYFFEEMEGAGTWGGTSCISNPASLKIVRDRLQPGDLVLAWQSDKQAAYGLCRIAALEDDGDDVEIVLETVVRFPAAVKLLKWKSKSPALANGTAFVQGKLGTLFETTAAEAKEILRICEVDRL